MLLLGLFSITFIQVTSGQMVLTRSNVFTDCFPNNNAVLLTLTPRSTVECGTKCGETAWCLSFIYDSVNKNCYLTNRFLRNLGECYYLPNIIHFEASKGTGHGYDCDVYPGSCVKILNSVYAWQTGSDQCYAEGARLLIIDSQAKQEITQQYMADNGIGEIWIGISDLESEGTFRYVDGGYIGYNWFKWGQPDNMWFNQDCVAVNAYYSYEWDDENCSYEYHIVCEMVRVEV